MLVISQFKLSDKYYLFPISKFKIMIGGSLKVVYNTESDKYSVQDEFNVFYRCQHNINTDLPMAFLIERGKEIEESCLVNISNEI